jgi:hypothetical protein
MSAPALSPRPRLVDTDAHNVFADIRAELRPYLSRHWQVYAERHGIVVPSPDYVSPSAHADPRSEKNPLLQRLPALGFRPSPHRLSAFAPRD